VLCNRLSIGPAGMCFSARVQNVQGETVDYSTLCHDAYQRFRDHLPTVYYLTSQYKELNPSVNYNRRLRLVDGRYRLQCGWSMDYKSALLSLNYLLFCNERLSVDELSAMPDFDIYLGIFIRLLKRTCSPSENNLLLMDK
jgi:hypothetical protein